MSAVPVTIGRPASEPESGAAPGPLRFGLGGTDGYDVSVFSVGLACCAVEFVAAAMRHEAFAALGVTPWASEPGRAGLMVVSGTVTDKMAPAVKALYDQMPDPKHVISFGSCANSGGPYWDSYCVTKGVDQLIPVDIYVPGCPPRPEALLAGIRDLQAQLARQSESRR